MAFDLPGYSVASNYLASYRPVGKVEGFANVLSNSGTNALARIPGDNQAMATQLTERALAEQGGIKRQKLVNEQAAENSKASLAKDFNIYLQQRAINAQVSELKQKPTLFDKLNLAATLSQGFSGGGSARGLTASEIGIGGNPLDKLNNLLSGTRTLRGEINQALGGSSGMTANALRSLPSIDASAGRSSGGMAVTEPAQAQLRQQSAPSVLRGDRAQDDSDFMSFLQQQRLGSAS